MIRLFRAEYPRAQSSDARDDALRSMLANEWLETNGLGDYASSTSAFCATRRYHGLLVARPRGSAKRHVFLSRFEEAVLDGGARVDLSIARYPGAWAPRGDANLRAFELAPHPRSTYDHPELGAATIEREVQMPRGEQAVLLRYGREGAGTAMLELRPFLPFREADALTVKNDAIERSHARGTGSVRFAPYRGLPTIEISCNVAFDFVPDPVWYERVELETERARGFPDTEDQYSPGVLRIPLHREAIVAVKLGGAIVDPAKRWRTEAARREDALARAEAAASSPAHARLAYAADDFYMEGGGRLGIDAGFPWFVEWGRDTFLALPGLTLARGDVVACERVLGESLAFLRDGLLPNIFGLSRGDSHYGSVDAALWFARAVRMYEVGGGSKERVLDEYLPALLEIASAYWDGTALEIRADEGGLIRAGNAELNATWMDARTEDGPVTPRHGCAVEINALWYSLMQHVELLLQEQGERKAKRVWNERRRRARTSFLERFWLDGGEYLADVWNPGEIDRSVRPNMVLAAALELSPLTKARRANVVERSRTELLTPVGLRTLARTDGAYRARYEGGPNERDGAYHQGTVWPWLFGFHVEAELRANGARRERIAELEATWSSIASEMDRAGLNHVSEVFDGDEPRRPGGTIAQAWNTAELLRARSMLDRGRA